MNLERHQNGDSEESVVDPETIALDFKRPLEIYEDYISRKNVNSQVYFCNLFEKLYLASRVRSSK